MGEVTLWEPPHQLGYMWHLRQDRADWTDVEITFRPIDASTTLVEIEHRGWERLGVPVVGPDDGHHTIADVVAEGRQVFIF